jgi:hypothetical protein
MDQDSLMFPGIETYAKKLINEVINQTIGEKQFDFKESRNWSNTITQKILQNLTKHNKNFKYLLQCLITSKESSSVTVSREVYWDSELDGESSIAWENDGVLCIINLYVLAI